MSKTVKLVAYLVRIFFNCAFSIGKMCYTFSITDNSSIINVDYYMKMSWWASK